jgi:hypothetical protein
LKMELNHAKACGWSVADTKFTRRALLQFPSIKPWAEGRFRSCEVKECLLVKITVQKGDCKIPDQKLVQEISNSAKMLGVGKIILMPYAHLSSENVAGIQEAKDFLLKLARAIRKENKLEIFLPPPLVDKSLLLEMPGHHYNCSLKSIYPNQTN